MGQVFDVFFIIGTVLILGFITSQIFERTKFPDVILLMFVGMLLGPVLKIVPITGTADSKDTRGQGTRNE